MAEHKWLSDTGVQTVISSGSALSNLNREAALYTNDTEADLICDVFLTLSYNATSLPTAYDDVADLYVLQGDGAATEVFPEGGDGTVGTNDDPQREHYRGTFQTINPSDTVTETISLINVPIGPHGNRFVIKNISGNTWDATWTLKIRPDKIEII